MRVATGTTLACLFALSGPAAAEAFAVEPWPLPAGDAVAAQPDLSVSSDGLLLSWTEKTPAAATTHRLRVARFAEAAWSAPQDIAASSEFFVNWADIPHVIALRDGTWWAHWLRRNGAGTYDYGIALTQSRDAGATWSAPLRVEPAGAKNDYGFVSFWEQRDGSLGLAWLDSRQKPAASHDAGAHAGHGAGAMLPYAARIDADGTLADAEPLDGSSCDCCPTAAAMAAAGAVVVYRGRSDKEVRDIHIVRSVAGQWTKPHTVHDDDWVMPACPVNGPDVVARGERVAVAWYTEAGGVPTLRLAHSDDGGAMFDPPLDIVSDAALLGRVALADDADSVWLAWLMDAPPGQALWLARFDAKTLLERERVQVATLHARGSASGLPRLQLRNGTAYLAWTDVVDGAPRLRGVRVAAD